MTTPEEEEEAVEEDMSTTVKADAALNKDKDSASAGKTVKCTFPFSLLFLICYLLCFSLFSFSPAKISLLPFPPPSPPP